MKSTFEDAVGYAREQVAEGLVEFAKIEAILSRHDMDVAEISARLGQLSASDTSWVDDAQGLPDLAMERIERAMVRGLSQPDNATYGAGPYVRYVKEVLEDAAQNPAAFDALLLHAANLLSANVPHCYELKTFLVGYLRNEIDRPAGGRRKLHEARNAIFHAIICDLVDCFDVKPTKNRASYVSVSACDILAEAMPNRPDLPKSVSSLERIWFRGESAAEREFGDEHLAERK